MSKKIYPIGSTVKVRFGLSDVEAMVVEHRFHRVRVSIRLDGASEPITTSYPEDHVQLVNTSNRKYEGATFTA